jgi:hypothetical protein
MDDLFSIARKDRDAWAAIRGYVYQVDTTILRWLNLGSGETIEIFEALMDAGAYEADQVLRELDRRPI